MLWLVSCGDLAAVPVEYRGRTKRGNYRYYNPAKGVEWYVSRDGKTAWSALYSERVYAVLDID